MLAGHHHHWHPAHQQHQQHQTGDPNQAPGLCQHRGKVEAHARDNKEDRHQEASAHTINAVLKLVPNFCLGAEDGEGVCADYGCTFSKEWHQIFFQDPEGNVVEIHQEISK